MELQNAQLSFAPRTTITSSGAVTTIDTTGTKLIDSGATFQSDGVIAGATLVNFTDQSISSVISIDSEIQLTCHQLAAGLDNQFDSSDVYKIWNSIQCNVAGGNLVAVDDMGASISAIHPTFGTHVLKTSSSSATQVEGGGATVDEIWDEVLTTHTVPDSAADVAKKTRVDELF